MKRFLFAAALIVVTSPVLAADLGVSVSIGQPGFYGRLDIGGYPPPQLIYRQPVIIERVPVMRQPIYLNVPPGHAKHWSKNCHKYRACGERVYFVQNNWYNREYVPQYQEQRHHREDYREDYRRDDRHDQGDGRRDDHHGKQKEDKGHGNYGKHGGNRQD
ncbi:hypothetical protein [Candidatus Accumulibacter sp. ACC003]|uniref:hypothetical protein n=1 Tax=Candidatus Accumulibacter sp. ACC003 TaxID=2823334 RepID=UPI0025B8338A|nr:hypothetical protein [Candidatus Accumulibacter sp. ACC003]